MGEIDEEGIELSLGMSLNGRFGVDPKTMNLKRSASTDVIEVMQSPPQVLERTCSLPVETEEETRKRKDVQMLRRLEAKQKRAKKQRDVGRSFSSMERRDVWEKVWNGGFTGSGEDVLLPPLSQASSGSSGLSELESHAPPLGTVKVNEAKSPQSVHCFSEHRSGMTQRSGKTEECMVRPCDLKRSRSISGPNEIARNILAYDDLKRSRSISGSSEIAWNMLKDMPSVWTKGDGPNGRRVEGFLYGYRKGEDVRIVCVCHGSFLTPAEFIKHAGGGDVDHPLRHIVVNPSPFSQHLS